MTKHTTHDPTNKTKYCECGCGQPAPIAKRTDNRIGHVKGHPVRFISGHNVRTAKRKITPPHKRFWKKVERKGPNECWNWTGATTVAGYGEFYIRNRRKTSAHRFSYELHYGPIPKGKNVCHHCDNPPCCNPAHLWVGTDADNVADKVNKGRQPRGTKVGNAKLTPEKVRRIRKLSKAGMSYRNIAARFGVGQTTIWRVIVGRTWKHV